MDIQRLRDIFTMLQQKLYILFNLLTYCIKYLLRCLKFNVLNTNLHYIKIQNKNVNNYRIISVFK